jgi:TonB family protein
MNAFQRKITLRVVGIHAAIILVFLIGSLFRSCTRPKPPEIITFIEFGGPAPQVDVEQVSEMSNPEPEVEQPPPPEPEPAPIPEPVKKKPEPIKKPDPVKKKPEPIKKAEPVKKPEPTWKPVESKNIKIGKKVGDPTPKPKSVSAADIKKAIGAIGSSPSKSSGNPNRFNYYYSQVMAKLHAVWVPPSNVSSISGSAELKIFMRSNGSITSRKIIKSSGNSSFDQTVMKAANSVTMLPKPPSDYNFNYVVVPFAMPE